jgi:hypothetical protein
MSGKTTDVSKAKKKSFAGGLTGMFIKLDGDATPGGNWTKITGIPSGTRYISCNIMEWSNEGGPWWGDGIFSTTSVQLQDDGTNCILRVYYDLAYDRNLPVAASIIYG